RLQHQPAAAAIEGQRQLEGDQGQCHGEQRVLQGHRPDGGDIEIGHALSSCRRSMRRISTCISQPQNGTVITSDSTRPAAMAGRSPSSASLLVMMPAAGTISSKGRYCSNNAAVFSSDSGMPRRTSNRPNSSTMPMIGPGSAGNSRRFTTLPSSCSNTSQVRPLRIMVLPLDNSTNG